MSLPQPNIVVGDSGNGTGAYVNITGSDPASTNTVMVTLTDQPAESPGTKWGVIPNVSCTGDGTLMISAITDPDNGIKAVPVGVNLTHAWYVQVISTKGMETISSVVGLVCPTKGTGGLLFKAAVSAQLKLIGANIGSGAIGGKVWRCESPAKFFAATRAQLPGMYLAPGVNEDRRPQTNQSTLWVYPLVLGVADFNNEFFRAWEDHDGWRNAAMQLFDRRLLNLMAEELKVQRVTIQPGPIVHTEGVDEDFLFSSFALNCEVTRNIGG